MIQVPVITQEHCDAAFKKLEVRGHVETLPLINTSLEIALAEQAEADKDINPKQRSP